MVIARFKVYVIARYAYTHTHTHTDLLRRNQHSVLDVRFTMYIW